MTLPLPSDPRRLLAHAIRVGDLRLARLLVARLSPPSAERRAAPGGRDAPLVAHVVLTLHERLAPPRSDPGPRSD